MLSVPENTEGLPRRHEDPPTPVLDDSVDHIQLLPAAARAIRDDEPVRLDREIANVHRTVGALLSGEVVRRRGPEGLPEGTIDVVFTGSAGQSFAAWLAPGVTFTVDGTVNDYAGKGLSGGVFAVRPPAESTFDPDENVIAATWPCTAPPPGARSSAVWPASASACATRARWPWSRAWVTTAAST